MQKMNVGCHPESRMSLLNIARRDAGLPAARS
jgi:hypothetical protein